MMRNSDNNNLVHFCIAGINYRKSDIAVRGKFSLSQEQSQQLLKQAAEKNFTGCMVLSTCNRTEVYGICNNPEDITDLLCIHTHGTKLDFGKYGYVKSGIDAVTHLFKVASGLDSQIVGDYEILSQLKYATKISRQNGCLNGFMERIINYALQASKEIKSTTRLSFGTVSVAYAAIEIIKEKITNPSAKNILLAGTGKFGNLITKNIHSYLEGYTVSLTNRTDEKALQLSRQYNTKFVPYNSIGFAANEADIIIVSSSSETYTILPEYFTTNKPRLVLDLSVPQNVDPAIKLIPGIDLMNVDEISTILNHTIQAREAEIPAAMNVIDATLDEMIAWYRKQSDNPVLRKVKSQLYELSGLNSFEEDHAIIHKTVSSLALNLRDQNNKGCQCIHALSSYLHMNYATTG
jgi:glutamyl-tRNA reductase